MGNIYFQTENSQYQMILIITREWLRCSFICNGCSFLKALHNGSFTNGSVQIPQVNNREPHAIYNIYSFLQTLHK